jgi:superkiller protein 3
MATLTLQCGQCSSALALLSASSSVEKERNLNTVGLSLSLWAIAESLNDVEHSLDAITIVQQAQKAVMLSPWHLRSWQSLAYVRSKILH